MLAAAFLRGGGEMGAQMRAKDWSATPLGNIDGWSPALRTMTSTLLANRFPMLLWWGPEWISIYNDAYIPVLGVKHPDALGLPVRECWSEIYDILQPLILTPFTGGPPTWSDDLQLEIRRHGFLEETHWTIAYSPVPDDTAPNGVGGVLATVHEITAQVTAQRRNALLRDLGARPREAQSDAEVCVAATDVFVRYAQDIPFALIYSLDADRRAARLAAATGVKPGEPACPLVIDLARASDPGRASHLARASETRGWPLGPVARSRESVLVTDLASRFARVPSGPWSDPPHRALAIPIGSGLTTEVTDILVVGISPRLELDATYRVFLDLVGERLASALGSARAYEQERRRAEALTELDRAKTAFFSNVSHEFRTPLTLMLGPVEEALNDTAEPLSPAHRQRQEAVHRNALRLLKLVNSLLDFSRIEAGRVQADYVLTDIAALTAELASTFRSLLERAGLNLTLDCPPVAQQVFVDHRMWENIVLNLISNAFKFTFAGGITVRLRADERAVYLTVGDTGIGIDAQDLPHIFERFYRAEHARGRTYEGTGIGLALVRELARLHGGEVTVESEPGRGATFTVIIPVGKAHLPAERVRMASPPVAARQAAAPFVTVAESWTSEPASGRAPAAQPTLDPASGPVAGVTAVAARAAAADTRLLIADDNADMRAYLERLLQPLGTIEVVTDGREALAAIERRMPDVLVTDVMMPNLDGLGLVRAVRQNPRTTALPIIVLSARAGEESRVEGARMGADEYIVKPFSARELVARVSTQLQLARQRREHAQALRDSEQRFRALVAASADVVYRASPDWSQMRELAGGDISQDTGAPDPGWLQRCVHPDDQARVMSVVNEAIRGKSVLAVEHRVLEADGGVSWSSSRAVPLLDGRGEIVEWFGAATDVTDRKQAESDLRFLLEVLGVSGRVSGQREIQTEGCRLLRVHLGASMVAFSEPRGAGRFQTVAVDAANATNATKMAPQSKATPPRMASAPLDRLSQYGTDVETAARAGRSSFCADVSSAPGLSEPERAAHRAAGLVAWANVPLVEDGVLVALMTVHFARPHDWSAREVALVEGTAERNWTAAEAARVKQALQGSERMLAEAQRVGHVGSWELDIATGQMRWSQEEYAIFGVSRESFAPTLATVLPRVLAEDRPAVEQKLAASVASGEPLELDVRIVTPDRGTRVLHARGEVTRRNPDGSPCVMTGISQDITERRGAEQGLEAAHKRLVEIDQRRDHFIAMLSHELRNPLSPMVSGLEILARATPGSAQSERAISVVRRQVDHLRRIIDDLLDVTRIARGKVALAKELLDLNLAARRIVDDHRPEFAKAGVEIEFHPADAPAWINADPTRLAQIVGNLLGNAAKFTSRGGRTDVSVHVAGADGSSRAVLRVSDTGRGIEPDVLPRLFEPFMQADTSLDRQKGGLGLGLSVVKGLVQLHDGAIRAESGGAELGTTIVVELPIAEGTAELITASRLPPDAVRRRVLVIDDNEDARESLRELLEIEGHAVEVAGDGSDGLQKAKVFLPEVVLCDIGLPGMDGYEVAGRFRADRSLRAARLVALSGYARPEDVARGKAAGFDAHLAKPASAAAMSKVLE